MTLGDQPLSDLISGGDATDFGWPDDVPLEYRVDDVDGDAVKQFAPGRGVEVWLTPLEPEARAGARILVDGEWRYARHTVTIFRFPNYPAARHAADVLSTVVAELNRSARGPIPTRDDGHRHVIRAARFSRSLPVAAICELCMETLCDDLLAWAHATIILPAGVTLPANAVGLTFVEAFQRHINEDRP